MEPGRKWDIRPHLPDFGPGAGWHKVDGDSAPLSGNDRDAMAQRAYRCFVLRLRFKGALLPPAELLCQEPVRGALLMMQSFSGHHWDAHLFDDARVDQELLFLARARLVRQSAGCRQYQGLERDNGKPRWPQTWLCTPTPERAMEIVGVMGK